MSKDLQAEFGQQLVAQIPRGHNPVIISKTGNPEEALFYVPTGKARNKTGVEYALKDIHKPIDVSEYMITRCLPDKFKSSLPSIEDIEAELEDLE
jgi:hypothetical protein